MLAIFGRHAGALGGLSSRALHLGWPWLLEAGAVGASTYQSFGPMLLVETQVVDQLLLDLEGLAALLTLVPAARWKRTEKGLRNWL